MSVINTNIQAIAAARALNASQEALGRSINRLSSGSKIVNPSDDAAGLAVSEKLDAQNKRVQAASTNVQNAISYLQTADGFMSGMTKILSRMSELAMLAKDVTKNPSDVALYQQEFTALQDQLRQTIGGTTAQLGGTDDITTPLGQFNGITLFGDDSTSLPNVTAGAFTVGSNPTISSGAIIGEGVILGNNVVIGPGARIAPGTIIGDNVTIGANAYVGPNQDLGDGVTVQPGATVNYTTAEVHGPYTITRQDGSTVSGLTLNSSGSYMQSDGSPVGTYAIKNSSGTAYVDGLFQHSDGTFWTSADSAGSQVIPAVGDTVVQDAVADSGQVTDSNGNVIGQHHSPAVPADTTIGATSSSSSSSGLTVTVGQAIGQTMTIPQINLRDGAMGALIQQDSSGNYLISLTSDDVVGSITDAIQDVATERATLGASQSRLELASTTLQVEYENLESAISSIRDVDVASESTQYAKYNILVQSGTAMLAQANQSPNSVLKLLQS